jgi:hypothetical protein
MADQENAQPEKTPEQTAQERLERYQKDPLSFVEMSDVILAAVRNPKSQIGISVAIGQCKRSELDVSWAEMQHIITKFMIRMDVEADMKRQAAEQIIKPGGDNGKHRIMDFMRKK